MTASGQDQEWCLEVACGPNAGAHVALKAGDYRFGRAAGNDIVLADPAFAERQGVLRIAPDSAVLDVMAPGLSIGRRGARPGRAVSLIGGVEIAVGDTLLRVHGPARQRSMLLPLVFGGPALLVAALSIACAAHNSVPRSAIAAATELSKPMGTLDGGNAARDPADDLTQRIRQAGLDGRVHVDSSLGAITINGEVGHDDMVRWRAVEQWFDAHHTNIALISRVAASTGPVMPQIGIRAVWAGPIPYVITTTDDRYTEGAVIDGGWTITHIGADGVELARDGRVVHITL
jgi:type III secretion protein D